MAINNDKLRPAAEALLAAAYAFWDEHQKHGVPSAVVWLTDTDGRLLVFTRGEYREQILANIDRLPETPDVVDLSVCPDCGGEQECAKSTFGTAVPCPTCMKGWSWVYPMDQF